MRSQELLVTGFVEVCAGKTGTGEQKQQQKSKTTKNKST